MPLPSLLQPAQLDELLRERPSTRLLDVRTPGEFETLHLPGAVNVPLDLLGEQGAALRAVASEPFVLVCQSGQRARRAEQALRAAGLPNLYVLDGGVGAWAAAGLPVVRGRVRLSLERQVRIAAGALAALGAALALLVHPAFAAVPLFVGSGLVVAGLTDTCLLGMLLARLPYNRGARCDVGAAVGVLSGTSTRPPELGGRTA